MWTADVPDIFALLPQEYADDYFSLDMLAQEGIMCLGGPNFDLKILTTKIPQATRLPSRVDDAGCS